MDRGGNPAATTEADFAAPTQVEQSSPAIELRVALGVVVEERSAVPTAMEHLAGATASFAFKGKTVTWFTVTGPTQGKASVWIDGHAKGTFNQYAPSMSFRVARSFHHLAKGDHTINDPRARPGRRPGAADAQVAVDADRAGGEDHLDPRTGVRVGEGEERRARPEATSP